MKRLREGPRGLIAGPVYLTVIFILYHCLTIVSLKKSLKVRFRLSDKNRSCTLPLMYENYLTQSLRICISEYLLYWWYIAHAICQATDWFFQTFPGPLSSHVSAFATFCHDALVLVINDSWIKRDIQVKMVIYYTIL